MVAHRAPVPSSLVALRSRHSEYFYPAQEIFDWAEQVRGYWGEQVRSVSVERIGPALGFVPARLMAQLDDALPLHLKLRSERP